MADTRKTIDNWNEFQELRRAEMESVDGGMGLHLPAVQKDRAGELLWNDMFYLEGDE